jgi:hypothetical protein
MDNQQWLTAHADTGLQPRHFADLIRTVQLIFDPGAGVSGRQLDADWESFGLSANVVENLKELGREYRYATPHSAIAPIWEKLTPETRSWLIENRNTLWEFEENFPALDED